MSVLRKITESRCLTVAARSYGHEARAPCDNQPVAMMMRNRNPRNLERMRIGYKPDGYHLEKSGVRASYWHRLRVKTTGRHITAGIEHFENGMVVTASTHEWSINKQLYRTTDAAAFINLGRVLAQRCLQCGLTEVRSDIVPIGNKLNGFLNAFKEGGVRLSEPAQFKPIRPWDQHRPEKPWLVTE